MARNVLALFALLAGFGLSGCITGVGGTQASVQQPSQEILDGTIRNPEDWRDAPRTTARRSARVTIGAINSGTLPETTSEAPKIYSEEWLAREKRENERLKGRMTICRGC